MKSKKKILFVFGTRPEGIKMAPVVSEIDKYPDLFEKSIVVTGQHRQMLDQVMEIFKIKADHDLNIMEKNQTLTGIVVKSLQGLEKIILSEKPDIILVQGDTSTAFAAGLIAYYHKIPVGHVEAGLRTFDKFNPFPEEINRKLLTSIAELHFAPTLSSFENLIEEKVPRENIYLTGNTVIDALLEVVNKPYDLKKAGIDLPAGKKLILVTTHRRENFGPPLENICRAIKRLAEKYANEVHFILPVHKNPIVSKIVNEVLSDIKNITLLEPLDYETFIHIMDVSYLILTDSGGVQEEAPSLGKPVLVMREKTERPDAVAAGTVKLVGMDEEKIFNEASKLISDQNEYNKMSRAVNPYGDGKAAKRIFGGIMHYFKLQSMRPEEFNVKAGN
ncbi:MAG: UDP-N-acetylglucosamine 2-epimerase (non-hydrolyzing) [Candidatus Margulisiibacteriota bacterium]